jgi:predicted metalloprotease with PDZ domain
MILKKGNIETRVRPASSAPARERRAARSNVRGMRRYITLLVFCFAAAGLTARADAAGAPMTLAVDARDATHNILHVKMEIPAQPGPFTLVYPEWIPGEHGPTGPINSVAALRIRANGNPVQWQRDLVDLYAFHMLVPQGASALDVSFDQLIASQDPMATPNLIILNWNRVLLYPGGSHSDDVSVVPSIELPSGWQFGTALAGARRTGDTVAFDRVSLSTLVDSPLDAGRYFRRIMLLQSAGFSNEIDIVADQPRDLDVSPGIIQDYKNLVAETDALYGARHWTNYHFLLSLSDTIGFQGIEHHQSSDNRASNDYLTDADALKNAPDLLPHEFSHSWNGKYRRPADLTTPDYQQPEKTDLLWVYEGLNQYLGDMLSFRSGLVDAPEYPEYLAHLYGQLDSEPGRLATPLVDTAISAPYLYLAPNDWASQRRTSGDFYTEGELVWLAADAIIRTRSHGAKSLDDFIKAFDGQRTTPPMVVTYSRQDVVDALNAVQPYDWSGFFQKYVYDVAPHPVALGIELTGYKLVWSSTPNTWDALDASVAKTHHFEYSLGFTTDDDGHVNDVLQGSPAALAGMGANTTIVAVNGRKFSADVLQAAVAAAKDPSRGIDLITVSDDEYRTIAIDYHGGERYPHLERVAVTPDLLAAIMAPRAHH